MRTARKLEAEWRQVLWGSVSTGTKEDKSSTRRVWSAGVHHVTGPFSLGGRFESYEPFIYLIFNFFSGRGKPRINEAVDTGARLCIILEFSYSAARSRCVVMIVCFVNETDPLPGEVIVYE
jgi:hypothetical protein